MGWAIVIGLLVVVVVVIAIVRFTRAKAEHEILQRLRPGVRFKAHGDGGKTLVGECIRIADDKTIEAFYTVKDSGSRREKGLIPIHKIFEVGS